MQNVAPVQLSQVRDFGQIISSTFQFLKQNWRPLFRSIAVICLPLGLLAGFFLGKTMGDIQSLTLRNDPGDPMAMFSGMMNSILPLLLGYVLMFAAIILVISITYEYLRAYQLGEHVGITPGDLWKRASGQLGSYLGTTFLSSILIVLGFVLCVLPGFYVLAVLALALACHAFERTGATGSMARSNDLVKGRFWETLGLVLVVGIIQSCITGAIMLPFTIVTMVFTMNSTMASITSQGTAELPSWMGLFTAISTALQLSVTLLTYPIIAVALAMKYFTLVEEKEGAGLRKKMEGFEQA